MSDQIDQEKVAGLRGLFEQEFGAPAPGARVLYVHGPARSEIAGNHTDHEGGEVIAGSLDVSIDGLAVANGTGVARVAGAGFGRIEVALDDLSPVEAERNTRTGLVRGMAHELAATGRTPAGFDLELVGDIPVGGGLSSSAAIEAVFGRAMEALWEGRAVDAVELAQMSQRTENMYFGKPCGLMDQLAVCLGGLAHMDFADPAHPAAEKLALDFADHGYGLVLVKVGSDHSDLTDEYAAVPGEMQQVARALGRDRLCEVDQAAFDAQLPALRERFGDRSILRCVHYWHENALVRRRWEALRAGEVERFVELTRESGASSAMFLQNVSVSGSPEQAAMVALACAERLLDGAGAARIHGGGFGGTIQCFVPSEQVARFTEQMDAWLGAGSSRVYRITEKGAYGRWL